ncbi:MAG: hypothetical protein M0D57_00565 [Sphingobacteriales bacterium JAD_PAG50586_3]|nr:MAG: hypothetical protein M0D57_00565 [Sphingobacteriales bacterium JAD_PAG50586_3]
MKKLHFISVLFGVLFYTQNLSAQDSLETFKPKPVSIEEFIGDKRQFLQLTLNKVFVEKKRIGLLSITSYAADYKGNLNNNEFQNTSLIYHNIYKGIGINSGVSFTSIEGLKNFVGIHYMYQSRQFSLIAMPSYSIIKNNKISGFLQVEYKPIINKNWSLYTRAQLHYNHNFDDGAHFRSYAYSRLGLTYKYFGFGLAHNFDRYGADKNTKHNFGVFLKLTM